MAFPLAPTEQRAQQRAFYLATCENDDDSAYRIIKPLASGLFPEAYNGKYFHGYRPSSPPIPVDLPGNFTKFNVTAPLTHHKRQSSRSTTKALHVRRRSRKVSSLRPDDTANLADAIPDDSFMPRSLDFPEEGSNRSSSQEPSREKPAKGADKLTIRNNPLSKLFVKTEKPKVPRSDSESTISRASLNAPGDNFDTVSEASSLPAVDNFAQYSGIKDSETNSLTDDEAFLSDDTDTIDRGDASGSGSDEDSLDSAFTDIEGDSIIDSGPGILYDNTALDTPMLGTETESKKSEEDKNETSVYGRKPAKAGSFAASRRRNLEPTPAEFDTFAPLLRKRDVVSFPKISRAGAIPHPTTSKLSAIIQTRHISTNVNPLNFFSFSGANQVEGVRKAEISVFVPPKMSPSIEKLTIAGNVSVFDCIGYILLKLSEMDKEQELSFDPNHWRLELTDEDGELYDANFGVLDRTRLVASYNFPKYLALCKVKRQTEITSNEKQTPLPADFKQNLELYEERSRNTKEDELEVANQTENWDFAAPGGRSIEVKVRNIPSTSKVISFFVASAMLVGDLLDLICRQYQVDSTKFKLSGLSSLPQTDIKNASLLSGNESRKLSYTVPLENSQTLSQTGVVSFEMVPVIRNTIKSMLDVNQKRASLHEAGITPHSSAFLQTGITPPVAQLGERNQNLSSSGVESRQATRRDSDAMAKAKPKFSKKVSAPTSSSSIDNLISGRNLQLPTSLNTFYYKWKVFRKKAPLLTRVEKSLIIDGDYIHLAPTDDMNWKSGANEYSMAGTAQSGHHHHHYLHHYNYSKFYNETMLKTSSFHISQIDKLKSYKDSKSPTHFKIVIKKKGESGGKEVVIRKKYDLEAESLALLDEIFEKIKWALQLFNASNTN